MPGDAADAGNWLEPLGLASLITEGVVAVLAGLVLAGPSPTGSGPAASGAARPAGRHSGDGAA